jgi:hypothetical protein
MIVVLCHITQQVYFIKTKKKLDNNSNKAQKLVEKKGFKINNCDWMVLPDKFAINIL